MNPTPLQGVLFLVLVVLLIIDHLDKKARAREDAQRIRDLKTSNDALNDQLDVKQYGRPLRPRQDGGAR